MTAPLAFSAEVTQARRTGAPVVALESTIITHGMPFPQNLETARRVEAEVRAAGAVPATIAVMAGRLHVGLEPAELEGLASATGVMKLSRADLAPCLATGRTGATTVAATMIAADLAGIAVFATGGIGGVHRGAETSFDVSADLHELARTPVTVVAAGAKAILDLPKTLEVLETLGVPVIAVGQDELPAFWSRRSGLPAPLRMDRRPRPSDARPPRAPGRPARRQPDPGRGGNPARKHPARDRGGPGRGRAAGHRGQGGDTLPALPHLRSDRRPLASRQHRAHPQQRPPCRPDRRRHCAGAVCPAIVRRAGAAYSRR